MALYGSNNQGNSLKTLARLGSVALLSGIAFVAQPPVTAGAPTPGPLQGIFRWQEPPAYLIRRRSNELLGKVAYTQIPFPTPPSGWDQTPNSDIRTPAHRIRPRSVDLLSAIQFVAQPPVVAVVADQFDIHSTSWRYWPAQRSVSLLGQVSTWPAQEPTVVFQEGWRSAFSEPQRSPLRSIQLRDQFAWAARPPFDENIVDWQSAFSLPVRLSPLPRLEGQISWPGIGYSFIGAATPSDYWFWRWEDPPKAAARSVQLRDQFAWTPQYFTEYQEGWRSQFSNPPALQAARRATNLLESWPWPGYGFFLQPVTGLTPSDLWHPRWQDPPKAKAQAISLLGDQSIWAARPPIVVYQEGWRSAYALPPILGKPRPRQQGAIAFATEGFSFTVFPEGWRSAYALPGQLFSAKPRYPGAISFAGLGYSFVAAPTPSVWWWIQWTDPPKPKPSSIALRQSAWPSWAPQFIVQVAPPTAGVPVSFAYGVRRGAAMATGAREGATLTPRVKRGRPSLSTRVKPPPH